MRESIWSVVTGVLFVIVATTLVDVVLHVAGVYPPMNQPLNTALVLLAIPQSWAGGRIFDSRRRAHHPAT